MSSTSFRVEGFADLERALEELPAAMAKGATRRAMTKAAKPLAELASQKAPEGSGLLKRSIIVGAKLTKRQSKQVRLERRMLRDGLNTSLELFVGPSYLHGGGGRHGHLVEFGTRPGKRIVKKGENKGKEIDHPGTAPQPFMRPAWESDKLALLERLKNALAEEVRRAALRLARKRRGGNT